MSERIIISGEPGTTWTNDTEKVQYQFIAALNNTCGVCLQYHMKIGPMWPIPIHYGCRCIQRLIKPGQTAGHPFVDYRELLEQMPQSEKRAAIGASNYKLLQSGAVKWDDIVTPSRVRDFREVVANKRLSVKQLTDHGVNPRLAKEAHAAVHTPEHEAVEAHRQELLRKLTGAGLSQENLVRELSKGLAARVTIAAGPTGPYTEGPAWSGGPLPVPGGGMSGAAELAKLITGWRPPKPPTAGPTVPKPPPAPPPVPLPTAAPVPTEPEPEPKVFTDREFGWSNADVHWAHGAEAQAEKVFGREISGMEIASLSGAPDGSKVRIRNGMGSDIETVIHIEHPMIEDMQRTIRREGGKVIIHNDIFKLKEEFQDSHIGLTTFARQVENAHKAGVARIETNAFRKKGETYIDKHGVVKEKWAGYYVWPRYGYNGPLDGNVQGAIRRSALPARLKAAKKISQLMAEKSGRDWWKENGSPIDVRFDLKRGSYSMKTLDKYLQDTR